MMPALTAWQPHYRRRVINEIAGKALEEGFFVAQNQKVKTPHLRLNIRQHPIHLGNNQGMEMNSRKMMTPNQTSEYLGVTVGWLAKRRVYGDGPRFTKLLGRILYDQTDLDDFVEQNKHHSTSEAAGRKA